MTGAGPRASVFRVLLQMRIRPGLERDFERAWREIGRTVAADPASLRQWLNRSSEDRSVYFVLSDWADEAHFREFERSARHQGNLEKLRPYRSGGSMSTMHVVYSVPSGTEPE